MVKYNLWGKDVNVTMPKKTFPSDDEIKKMEEPIAGSEHGWFESNGSQIHFRKFSPPKGTPIRASVVFCHGIQSHSGVAFLVDGRRLNLSLLQEEYGKKGYVLYAFDLLGHGFSEGLRHYVPDYKINKSDYSNFGKWVVSQHPDVPIFLSGESYGGTLTLHVAHEWEHDYAAPKNFAGIVMTAPAVIGDLPPAPVVFILRYFFAALFPEWTPFFMPNPVSPDRIWKDEKVRDLHLDPRKKEMQIDGSGNPFRLGTAVQLLNALEDVRDKIIPALSVPFCVVHGEDDMSVPVSGTEFLDEHAKTPKEDKVIHRLKGAYHDVLGDPAAEQAAKHLVDFIETRISKQSKKE
eukprot:CAMPEP_0194046662 /NCGR_PEP_ID=MMETSP0009_2-20130614/22185_1 /TAXON_ID=210454 /ORGANISM="Grammatophora oceanica, Strain CCMP 410" /LENGTH=347 /DNA_ID=CAMNT_0038692051 /DNA_START=191 /DNA_END=1234 /DNA_ORIENTATION=+